MIALVGGKAASLGALIRAGLPVPDGFCITTAAYTQISAAARLDSMLEELATIPRGDVSELERLATRARAAVAQTPMPTSLTAAISGAYHALSAATAPPVA